MIKILVKKSLSCPINTVSLKKVLADFFKEKGIVSDADASVTIVGKDKMYELAKQYLGEKNVLHNVLSFPEGEVLGEFKYPPKDIIHLGEIVICYPKVVEEANQEGVLIDKKASELVLHGAQHLLGIHHK